MANQNNLHAKQKPSKHPQHPHPPHFSNGHPLVINIMYTWRTQKIYVQSRSPPSTPSTPTPLTFLMVHPLVIVEITQQMA